MLGIHVKVAQGECEDELPYGAIFVSCKWLSVATATFSHEVNILPEFLPRPPSCCSRCSFFVDVVVVHKARLDVAGFGEQRPPLQYIHGLLLSVRSGIFMNDEGDRGLELIGGFVFEGEVQLLELFAIVRFKEA